MKRVLLLVLLITYFTQSFAQDKYEPTWESLSKRQIPSWFTNAKFGIFIHWGLYSVPSWATNSNADGFGSNYAEWYWERLNNTKLKIHKDFFDFHQRTYGPNFKYQDFAPMFKCELFNPDQWAEVFKNSGAKYVVLTSKHHDGFALWPSRESWNWNAVDAGPHRDLAGDLSAAVKKAGLHMGFYYSLYEWYNPLYKQDVKKYVDQHMLPQMKDLVTRYQPEIIWPDGQWEQSDTVWRSREFLTWLYNDSPVKNTVVTNDRWGGERQQGNGGFTTTEYGKGNSSLERPWEECRGIGESFGYNRNENLEQYVSSEKLVHMLIDIVSRGGNLLLNIGPDADGTIPVIMQQRLKDMGDWLKVNGEAIYETTAWKEAPHKPANIFYTRKGNDLYVITTRWNKSIEIPVAKAKEISMLGYSGKCKWNKKGNKIIIKAPAIDPGNTPCQYAWTYKITNAF